MEESIPTEMEKKRSATNSRMTSRGNSRLTNSALDKERSQPKVKISLAKLGTNVSKDLLAPHPESERSMLSVQSFASAAHYHDQNVQLNSYIENHPLTQMLQSQSWNNIPLPIREIFSMISDALIGQDIHTWERKSLINERFFKMQHLCKRLHDRIHGIKGEMTRWIEDIIKRSSDNFLKTNSEFKEREEAIFKRMNQDKDNFRDQLDRIRNQQAHQKKEFGEMGKKTEKSLANIEKRMLEMMNMLRVEMNQKVEGIMAQNLVDMTSEDMADSNHSFVVSRKNILDIHNNGAGSKRFSALHSSTNSLAEHVDIKHDLVAESKSS